MATFDQGAAELESLLQNGDDIKKAVGATNLTPSRQKSLFYTKVTFAVILFISAAAALGVVLGLPETFSFPLMTTQDYRNDPNDVGLADDGYPAADLVVIGNADVGLIAAFVSVLAWIGFTINAVFHPSEMTQLSRGANPWFWLFSALWTPVAFLTIQYFAGIHNVYVHVLLWLGVWGWIFLFWADDLLHSNAYVAACKLLAVRQTTDASIWSWITIVQGLIFAIVVYVVIFIYLGFTFSAPAPDCPSSALLAPPITFAALYLLLVPVILILYRNRLLVSNIYYREMTFYISSGILALIATWLSLGIIAATKPHPEEMM